MKLQGFSPTGVQPLSYVGAPGGIIVGGAPGPRGEVGPVGPIGPQGIVGPQGPKGDKGDKGDQGIVGPVGPQGPIGATGPQGIQGPVGSQGIQGLPGASLDIQGTVADYESLPSNPSPGDAWLVADQGLLYYFDGTAWPADGNGVPFVGPQGPVGPQGEQGIQGIQGEQGIQGPIGLTGPKGDKGDKGDTGDTGLTGPVGPSTSLSVGTVVGGETASATVTGTAPDQTLNLVLPKGDKGDKGDVGATGAAGPAGATGAQGLQGAQGSTGPAGPKGDTGSTGPANSLSIGTVLEGAAAASLTGTAPTQVLNLTIPKGDKGDPGTTTWDGITDRPFTFTPSAHSHLISDVTGLFAELDSKESKADKGIAGGYASLDSSGKVPGSQLPNSIMTYQGLHDVVTNFPAASDATGSAGQVFRVSVAGTRDYGSGPIALDVGDYLIHSGTVWEKADTTDAVASVAGFTGNITADSIRDALGSGTPSSSTYLRGDGTWATIPASGITRSVGNSSVPLTLPDTPNTDFVYFLSGTAGTPAGAGDPHWSSVTSLLNFNSAVTTDLAAGATTWTNTGPTVLSTTVKRFGASSLYISTDGWSVSTGTYSGFDIGAGIPFTIEFWVHPTTITNDRAIFSMRPSNAVHPLFMGQQNGNMRLWVGNSALSAWEVNGAVAFNGAFAVNAWTHVAVVGTGTELWFYINGAPVYGMAQPSWPSANRMMRLGGDPWYNWFNGYFDDFRFTRGVARYSNAFLLPSSEFLANAQTPAVSAVYANPTLPSAVGNKNVYSLRNIFSLPITVSTTSSQTIEGLSSFTLDPGESFNFISDGWNWRIM